MLPLYAAGLRLPHVEPPDGIDAETNPERPAGWKGFDALEIYRVVFDPYEQGEALAGSLSDDLLDIYFDVKRGLDLWGQDVPAEAAIWEWKFHLDAHWGAHAVSAIHALHHARERAVESGLF